jgi:hypothetical protein
MSIEEAIQEYNSTLQAYHNYIKALEQPELLKVAMLSF